MSVHDGTLMMGDQFAVGSPDAMNLYARTFELFPTLIPEGLLKLPGELAGHVSLAYLAWLHGIRVERIPIKWQPLRDPQGLSTAQISRAVRADAGPRNDDWYGRLIAAIERDEAGLRAGESRVTLQIAGRRTPRPPIPARPRRRCSGLAIAGRA